MDPASQGISANRWGRSRGGLTSKIHAVVDSDGLPVRLALSPGEAHDVRFAGKLLSRLKSGSMLLADRGYDADWIRELAMKKGAWANIPPKSNRSDPICFSPYLYRARNQVERFFNRIKQCRRVATRYDRLAANYLAFVQLASIRLWLRLYKSASYFGGTYQWAFTSVRTLAVPESNDAALAVPPTTRRGKSTLAKEARKIAAIGKAMTK